MKEFIITTATRLWIDKCGVYIAVWDIQKEKDENKIFRTSILNPNKSFVVYCGVKDKWYIAKFKRKEKKLFYDLINSGLKPKIAMEIISL